MKGLLCIGGPLDGRFLSPDRAAAFLDVPIAAFPVEKVRYTRRKILDTPEGFVRQWSVFVLDGLDVSPEEALLRLRSEGIQPELSEEWL